jgi:hypothetical protein
MVGRPTVFTHIPKTAGSALNVCLRHALQPNRALLGFDHAIFGDFDEFDSIVEEHRQHIYARPEDLPEDADFIGGHFAYATAREAFPTARYLTVLREPVTRVLPHWVYWRGRDEASLAGWGSWGARVRTAQKPLAAFLNAPMAACQTDNLTLRQTI